MNTLTLRDYVGAGYGGIVYKTNEESRAIDEAYVVATAGKRKRRLLVWSQTKGIVEYKNVKISTDKVKSDDSYTLDMDDYEIEAVVPPNEVTPDENVFEKAAQLMEDGMCIFLMLDFHPNMNNPLVQRMAKDCIMEAPEKYITYVFVSATFDIPKELEHYLAVLEMRLPSKELLIQLVTDLVEQQDRNKVRVNSQQILNAAEAAMGLTLHEASDAISMSLYKTKTLDLDVINNIKRETICKGGLLNYTETSKDSLDKVGGMKFFTDFVQERLSGFSEEAKEENIPYPKGVLLVGIPGCGKSLAAKALANMWKKPLLQLDLGKLFGSFVGETEERTRDTLKLAEAMAPCILWLDEIEKGLSGVSSSGSTDSGVTSRMFGTILTWLQEKEKPVFVIATANSITNLPQELLRKGRFDEIFFVDLPNLEEREEILEIQIKKYQGKKYKVVIKDEENSGEDTIDLKKLAELTDGFSGAEIESLITSAKYRAFNESRAYTMEDLKVVISEAHPAAKGFMAPTVSVLRDWRDTYNVKNANASHKAEKANGVNKTSKGKRVIID